MQINDYYEKPKIITLDNTIHYLRINNINTVDEKKVKGVILPLKFQFRKYCRSGSIYLTYKFNYTSRSFSYSKTYSKVYYFKSIVGMYVPFLYFL